MSASVVRRALRRDAARFAFSRGFHTEPRPLETPEDWTDFQLERANYKTLSEYVTAAFSAPTYLSSQLTTSPSLVQLSRGRILSNPTMASIVLLLLRNFP